MRHPDALDRTTGRARPRSVLIVRVQEREPAKDLAVSAARTCHVLVDDMQGP